MGRFGPGGSPFSSPLCWTCRRTEVYDEEIGPCRSRVWRRLDVAPRGNCRRALAPGALPLRNQAVRWGFPNRSGIIDLGDVRGRPRIDGDLDVRKEF